MRMLQKGNVLLWTVVLRLRPSVLRKSWLVGEFLWRHYAMLSFCICDSCQYTFWHQTCFHLWVLVRTPMASCSCTLIISVTERTRETDKMWGRGREEEGERNRARGRGRVGEGEKRWETSRGREEGREGEGEREHGLVFGISPESSFIYSELLWDSTPKLSWCETSTTLRVVSFCIYRAAFNLL